MSRLLSSSTALALVLASAAQADVTPEEVWANWQALVTSAGQELTVGEVKRDGDTLAVTGLVITLKDDLGGAFAADIDTMNFKDNGDGTVAVTVAETYPMSITFPPDEEGPSSLKLTVSQPGLLIGASGTAEATDYTFTAPTVTVTLDEILDQSGTKLDTQAELVLTDTTAAYKVSRDGETTQLDSSFSSKSVALNLAGKDPEGTGQGVISVTAADLAGTAKGTLLGADVMANLATALNQGFTTDSDFTFGALSFNADITDDTGPVKLVGTLGGGAFGIALDRNKMDYSTAATAGRLAVSGPEIPFPEVVLTFAESGFGFLMPVSKADTPQDFAFATRLVDFTISDEVWAMIDPGAALSREPATVIFDVKGTGFWTQDIMDPNVQMDGAGPPGELSSLDLTQVLVKAAGAEVGATGGLTFDNGNLESFGGMPAPTGTIDVTIKGVNALIDNLIAIGLLPEDQAMGARMMLGVFARPGAGPDELVSQIEFRDGGIFANGQQLQ